MKRVPLDRRCQLMAAFKPSRSAAQYFRAPLRLCRSAAVALVQFVDVDRPTRICEECLLRILSDYMTYTLRGPKKLLAPIVAPSQAKLIVWFEPIHVSRRGKPQREYSPALELVDKYCVNRAPTERSWEDPDAKERRRQAEHRNRTLGM